MTQSTIESGMTLKQFKDQFVVGAKIHCDGHWISRHVGKDRTIVKVQGNGFFFHQTGSFKPDGVTPEMFWSPFPKKRELTFNDDGSFTIRPENGAERSMFWTERFIEGGAA